ncbi:MAG: SOS response-associated peptidase, partial [Edaphobacter sp.]
MRSSHFWTSFSYRNRALSPVPVAAKNSFRSNSSNSPCNAISRIWSGSWYATCYNIAPSTYQPVVHQVKDFTARELVPMRWGVVGSGTKGIDPKLKTFNAREEGLTCSDLWRAPFERRRCLVPADGFYDFRKADQWPFRFTLAWPEVFAFAGLWDAWKDPTNGTWLQSFAIITTAANEHIQSVSD